MKLKKLLRPNLTTWILFGVFNMLLLLNILSLNFFDKGFTSLVFLVFYFPFLIFTKLSLPVISPGSSWISMPNLFGYTLIVIFNLFVIYIVSFIISKIIKKLFGKSK